MTENGTESDVTFTGFRTSTPIAFSYVPLSAYVDTITLSCLDLPPPDGKSSVFQVCPESSPSFDTQR